MSILPWDDWFYHLSKKHRQLNEDYNKYMRLRDEIELSGNAFNHKLDQLQVLVIYNTALLINLQMSTLSDVDYVSWLKQHDEVMPPDILERSNVIKAFQTVTEASNCVFMTIAIKRFTSRLLIPGIKQAWRSILSRLPSLDGGEMVEMYVAMVNADPEGVVVVAEEVSETLVECGVEEAASIAAEGIVAKVSAELLEEPLVESAVSIFAKLVLPELSNLALFGGIFTCVGIDAILGAIAGAKEDKDLKASLQNMTDALNKVQEYINCLDSSRRKLDEELRKVKKSLLNTLVILDSIQKLPSDIDFQSLVPEDAPLMTWISVFCRVVSFYGILSTIRNSAEHYIINASPHASYEGFKNYMRLLTSTVTYPDNVLYSYIDYVARNSVRLECLRHKNFLFNATLPFDKMCLSNIDCQTRCLKNLKSQYIIGHAVAAQLHEALVSKVGIYKSMVAYNTTLLVAAMTLNATDHEFASFLHIVENGVDDPPNSYIPVDVARNISDAAGEFFPLKVIYNISKVSSSGLFATVVKGSGGMFMIEIASSLEAGMTDISSSVEPVTKSAANSSESLPGIWSIVGVGMDAKIGLLDGKRRERELEQAKRKVNSAILKLKNYVDKVKYVTQDVDDAITVQEKNFIHLLHSLSQCAKPNFDFLNLSGSQSHLVAMRLAVLQYGLLTIIRKSWVYKSSHDGRDWDTFKYMTLAKHPASSDPYLATKIFKIVHSIVDHEGCHDTS